MRTAGCIQRNWCVDNPDEIATVHPPPTNSTPQAVNRTLGPSSRPVGHMTRLRKSAKRQPGALHGSRPCRRQAPGQATTIVGPLSNIRALVVSPEPSIPTHRRCRRRRQGLTGCRHLCGQDGPESGRCNPAAAKGSHRHPIACRRSVAFASR